MTVYTKVFGGDNVPPSDYAFSSISLTANIQLNWPDNSTGGSMVAPIMEVTATAGPWTLTLPSATEISTGRDFVIRNIGANSFNVKDYSGTIIATIAAGTVKYFYNTNNSTSAGAWSVFTYGTGTSAADASALAGNGLVVDGTKLTTVFTPEEHAVGFTLAATDSSKLLVSTGGAVTWILPDPATIDSGVFFAVSNSGTGTLTINADANGGLIDGLSEKQVQLQESLFIIRGSDSDDWVVVGYGRSADFQFTQLLVDVSVGGTSGITITSAQAGNKLWYFTGAASGDRTVTIPKVSSIYFVKVGSIGSGNSLTFTTGSGSTFTINSEEAYVMYCDGSNVSAAQTGNVITSLSLSDGSASSPSLYFTLDPDLGMYRRTANELGVSAETVYIKPADGSTQMGTCIVKVAPGEGYMAPGVGEVSELVMYNRFDTNNSTRFYIGCNTSQVALNTYYSGTETPKFLSIADNASSAGIIIDGANHTIRLFSGSVECTSGYTMGYGSGSGSTVTQTAGARTNTITINEPSGRIQLCSAAGSTSWTAFTVNNSLVRDTDVIIVNQKSGTDSYEIHITAIVNGSFVVRFRTTGGTTTETPQFNFAVIRGAIV